MNRAIESSQVVTAARPKSASLLPHVEEHIAQKIFSDGLVADEPEKPAIDRGAMPGEEHLHGELVARRDALNQDFIGGVTRNHCGGGRPRVG